jgi:small subunit ribosomal protein S6
MPRYEFMYILASSVSDDQIPQTTAQVEQYVTDFLGTDVTHTPLGKKKLAYPIKKTRNGHYGVVTFTMDTAKVNELEAKIRTQGNTIIRHIIVNIDEHLERMEKDRDAQAKMNRNRPASQIPDDEKEAAAAVGGFRLDTSEDTAPSPVTHKPQPKGTAKEVKAVTPEELDSEIEKALSEDITK